MAYSPSLPVEAPSPSRARRLRRRRYRGLGQALSTIQGVVRYASGEVVREVVGGGNSCYTLEKCEEAVAKYPQYVDCVRSRVGLPGDCWAPLREAAEVRPRDYLGRDSGAGFYIYIPDLIPTTGGTLPGYALLEGNTSGLQTGQEVTLRGSWDGRAPSNLGVNVGWYFKVEGIGSAEGAVDTGAVSQDSPDMIAARLEQTAVQEGDAEAAALVEALDKGQITPEEAVEAYEAVQETRRAAAEAEAGGGGGGVPSDTGMGDNGTPFLTAGLSTDALTTLIIGALILLPWIAKKKGGNRGGTWGVERWD